MYTCHVRMDRFALVSSVSSRLFLLDKDESSGTAALALMTETSKHNFNVILDFLTS